MIGSTLGPYQLIERLERLGLHETYRAIDPRRFGQPVAVTLADLPPGDEEAQSRFERAAEALTELRHPNILPLLDFGEADGRAYLVTPYLEGPSLASLIGRARRPAEALGLIATLGDALDHAHRQDLAHGELTPEAIQLVNLPPGEDTLYAAWPLLHNFGFAPLVGPSALEGSIADAYRPPEAHVEDPSQADCYALAGILHALLTGVPPKPGGDPAALATVAESYAAVLRRALSADPAERYASCPDLLVALRDAAAADRRHDDSAAVTLLEEARTAVAAGKFRAASEAYGAYLRLRPQDELARREFATIEGRRAELARRRAQAATASAAAALAATKGQPPPAAPAGETPAPADGMGADTPTIPPGPVPPMDARPTPPVPATRPPRIGGPLGVPTPSRPPSSGPPRAFDPLVAPARERRRAILPAALAALVLLAVIALAGTVLARRANNTSGTATAPAGGAGTPGLVGSPTGSRPIATGIPTGIPIAPTIAPITNTPVPTLPPLPPVISDSFDDHASGFPPVPEGGGEGSGYQQGGYALVVPEPDNLAIGELGGCPINGNCTFGDFQVEVDMRAIGPIAGGSYGLVFHRQFANSYTQYFVLVNPETGGVRLVRWVDTDRQELLPVEASHPAVARGEATNRLVVATRGTLITIEVNSTEIARINDPGPTIGTVGLRADSGAGPFTALFDNFVIRPVQ
jgi:serine/threonine-protein kinase